MRRCSCTVARSLRRGCGLGAGLHHRQPQQEARALGSIRLGADGAAVLLHDFGRNRQSQTRAAMLGRVVTAGRGARESPPSSPVPVSETVTSTAEPSSTSAVRSPSTRSKLPCMASAALSIRLASARRMASGSAITARQVGLQIPLYRNALKPAAKQRQRFFDNLIHAAGARLRRRKLRQRRELIDQRAQRAHAAQNHFAALANNVGRVRLAAIQMPANALGAQSDGRQRILDLVRHLLRHFLPRQLPLRAQQFRRVFHHQHRSDVALARVRAARW